MSIQITGVGSYVPTNEVCNSNFDKHIFLNEDGTTFKLPNETVIRKFKSITGIASRRYVSKDLVTSDIAAIAAQKAIKEAAINPETIDYIIVAHNFGDVKYQTIQGDTLPSLATRVKQKLQIQNPKCVAYDLLFGCPGWIEGVLQAKSFIKAGMAKKCLVIGAETLSRVTDPHDRDSMIYSDGAGATVIEYKEGSEGILAYESATYALEEANYLFFGKSYNQDLEEHTRYIKMHGRKIYEFALSNVPSAMKSCWDQSGIPIENLSKILIHQANEKMDEAIVERFYKLYEKDVPPNVMPMSIATLGNSSVATVPTLLDLVLKGEIENQEIKNGDVVLFASVGAGMNINAFVYQF